MNNEHDNERSAWVALAWADRVGPAMFARLIQLCSVIVVACALTAATPGLALAGDDGIVRVKSGYLLGETIERLKKDIAAKGIKFFSEIDQANVNSDLSTRQPKEE